MEKGFNDDELADIMNEIESLEKEFSEDSGKESSASMSEDAGQQEDDASHAEEFVQEADSASDEQVDEHAVLEQLADMPVEKSVSPASADDQELDGDDNATNMQEIHDPWEATTHSVGESKEKDAYDEVAHSKNVHSISNGRQDRTPSQSSSPGARPAGKTAMSFHVEGEMSFELSFHIGGKFVGLTVTEDGLEIGLDGGVKFSVPIEEVGAKKKSA